MKADCEFKLDCWIFQNEKREIRKSRFEILLKTIHNTGMENKKGGEVSTFFAPNLTMNLTYLCYGSPNIVEWPSI
jgi:hypothetical protein